MKKKLLASLLILLAADGAARAQNAACEIARAELAAFDRRAGGAATAPRQSARLDQLTSYYYAAGCAARITPLFEARPPQCDRVANEILRLRQQLASDGPRQVDPSRRGALRAAVDQACSGELSAASRGFETPDAGSSRIVIDENESEGDRPIEPPSPPPLGRAMCVRTCDGFYFPLTSSPGGREGADEMCQALCPASPTRAYFLERGSMDSAIDSNGSRYASLPAAYRFRRQISSTCGCKAPGENWSTALRRADELAGPSSDDVVVTERNNDQPTGMTLKPPVAPRAASPTRPRQAIDPEPLPDDGGGELQPLIIPPEPSGVVALTPRQPPPEPAAKPAAREERAKRSVRVVGPPVSAETGRPEPIVPPRRP